MKKILSACIKEIIEFDSENEYTRYIRNLRGGYEVLSLEKLLNSKVRITIVKKYNNSPLLEE